MSIRSDSDSEVYQQSAKAHSRKSEIVSNLKIYVEGLRTKITLAVKGFETMSKDRHKWSTRPCDTCDSISEDIGEPIGCTKFRLKANSEGHLNTGPED